MTSSARILAAHHPLPLDDGSALWVVEDGEVLVFAGSRVDDSSRTRPSCLVAAPAGDILLGSDRSSAALLPELVGIALAPARIRRIDRSELEGLTPAERRRLASALDRWILGVASALAGLSPPDGARRLDAESGDIELAHGKTLEGSPEQVHWIEIPEGRARWMGIEYIQLDGETRRKFPLAGGTWIEAEDSKLRVRFAASPDQGDLADLGGTLDAARLFQGLVLSALDLADRARADGMFERARERETRVERRVFHALWSLSHLVTRRQAPEFHEGSNLFRACAAAAESAGIRLSITRTGDDLGRERNPVEAVTRRSNVRCRQVLLRDRWHEQDAGPLVGFLEDPSARAELAPQPTPESGAVPLPASGRPVALLPTEPGRYEVYDPADDSHSPLTPQIEGRLRRQAYVLYAPFPDGFAPRPAALLGFAVRGHGKGIAILLATGIAATLLGMLVPQATGVLIDKAIPSADRNLATQIGLALLMTAFGRMLFELSRGFAMLRLAMASSHKVQASLMDRLLKLKVNFFRRYTVGDLLDRVMAVQKMFQQLSMATLATIFGGFFTLINLGLLVYYSPILSLYALGLAALNILATWLVARALVRQDRVILEKSSAAFGHVVQLVQGVSKIRAAAAEDRAFASWARKYRENQSHVLARQAIDDRLTVANAMLMIVGQLFLFWIAIDELRPDSGAPEISIGDFLAFNSAFGLFLGGITSLSNTITDVLGTFMLWERAKPILEAEPEVGGRRTQPGIFKGGVGLERVTFRYRDDCAPVLEEVALEARPGEFMALVGPSGCGKSTVLRLLLGFETPEQGKVVYDGQDLADLDVDAVRRQIGVVLQTSRVRSNSIFDNIAAGSFITMEEAWEASRRAAFEEDVRQMPMGMHTIVSEGGTNLSGGQRQRLLIARALVKRPRLLLLDEATSALDNRSQSIVTRSLAEMKVTRVVVAHRLSTIRGADRIYVLERGRVVQSGSFAELARDKGGKFHALMASQRTDRG